VQALRLRSGFPLQRKFDLNLRFASVYYCAVEEKNFVGVFVGWQVKWVYNHLGLNSSADEMQGC